MKCHSEEVKFNLTKLNLCKSLVVRAVEARALFIGNLL